MGQHRFLLYRSSPTLLLLLLLILAVAAATSDRTPPTAPSVIPQSIRGTAVARLVSTAYVATVAVATPAVLYASRVDTDKESTLRNELFSRITPRSKVLEVGFGASGSGANLNYYPCDISLTALDVRIADEEGESGRQAALTGAYSVKNIDVALKKGNVENMGPLFKDDSFDVVTSSLLLCSVNSPAAAIAEITRVLKKGGHYLSVEHILSDNDRLMRWQQRLLTPLQVVLADNCHLDRQTDKLFASANGGLEIVDMKFETFGSQYPISRQIYTVLRKT